ncbi:MAG: choice-of-anchor L domain-containing protein, partial [Pseudomonadota bacterium]
MSGPPRALDHSSVLNSAALLALEQRYLLDAAAAQTTAEITAEDAMTLQVDAALAMLNEGEANRRNADDVIQILETLSAPLDENAPVEVVFIDTAVGADAGALLANVNPNADVYFLDSSRDGVEQIAEILSQYENVEAVHIVSHGEQGRLFLGDDVLDLESMRGEHADELATIGRALSETGDILIYGCDFTGDDIGLEAARTLSDLTGADIAASSNDTGAARLGGDWVLETQIGVVATSAIVADGFQGLLAPLVVTPVDGVTTTALTLAQEILGTDVNIVSATLTGDNAQAGLFSGATGFTPEFLAFDEGIVLSSGSVTDLDTTNSSDGTTTDFGRPGDADFTSVAGFATNDAAFIEIDFIPTNDRIAIQFVLASEEYNEYVFAGINDAIGVFVNGSNIALTPSGQNIGIDTINNAAAFNPVFGSQAFDANPGNGVFDSAAPSLFLNNDLGLDGGVETPTSAAFAFEADGFTRTLGATVTVTPGVVNTIKIGVADAFDNLLDSWILIRADSFQANLIAENDTVGTTINTPVTFSPTANDIDFDADEISIVNIADAPITAGGSVTLSSGGVVTLNSDNSLTYAPPSGSTAPELFTYTVTDGAGNTATAYVNVNIVSGVAPMVDLDGSAAGSDYATTFVEDGAAVSIADIDRLVTDPDTDISGATIGISNAFADDVLTVGSLPAGVTVDPASTATNIILTGTASAADYAAAIEAITFSNSSDTPDTTDRRIAVQLTDTDGLSSNLAQTVVTVMATNDDPNADNETATIDEDTFVTIDVLDGDTDVDNASLTITQVDGQAIAVGSPVTLADGTIVALNMDGTLTVTPPLNDADPISFDYTISDGNGGEDTATVDVTVTPVADAPVSGGSLPPPVGAWNASDIDGDGDTGDNPLNGADVTFWNDLTGGGLNAFADDGRDPGSTITAPTYDATGANGNPAVDFSGTEDGLALPNDSDLNTAVFDEKTIHLTFTTGSDLTGFQVIYEQGGNVRGYSLSIVDGRLYAFAYNEAEWAPGQQYNVIDLGAVEANTTYTVLMVHDATAATLADRTFSAYLNGDLKGVINNVDVQRSHPGASMGGEVDGNTVHPLTFADDNGPAAFNGSISAFCFWNTALDGDQIATFFAGASDEWGTPASTGPEDTPIPLSLSNDVALADTDGSETLSLEIGSIPVGATITDGVNSFTSMAGDQVADVTGWDLTAVTITPPADFNGLINLTFSATAEETDNGDTETTSFDLVV